MTSKFSVCALFAAFMLSNAGSLANDAESQSPVPLETDCGYLALYLAINGSDENVEWRAFQLDVLKVIGIAEGLSLEDVCTVLKKNGIEPKALETSSAADLFSLIKGGLFRRAKRCIALVTSVTGENHYVYVHLGKEDVRVLDGHSPGGLMGLEKFSESFLGYAVVFE